MNHRDLRRRVARCDDDVASRVTRGVWERVARCLGARRAVFGSASRESTARAGGTRARGDSPPGADEARRGRDERLTEDDARCFLS